MFWQRRTYELQERSTQPTINQKTTATVREFAMRIDNDFVVKTVHKARVRKFTGLPDYSFPPTMLQELREAGFIWVVGPDFIRRFPYHAALGQDVQWHDHRVYVKHGRIRKGLVYAGDIPEFALDRVEKAQAIGIDNFTIHSMQSMPLEFLQIDPVLVGWPSTPGIEVVHPGKRNQRLSFAITDIIGIVVAVWDTDRELEV